MSAWTKADKRGPSLVLSLLLAAACSGDEGEGDGLGSMLDAGFRPDSRVTIDRDGGPTPGRDGGFDVDAVLRAAVDELEIGFAPGDSEESVTQDLSLPSSLPGGISVEWTSDLPFVQSDGSVLRPPFSFGDANVSLVATLRSEEAARSRGFDLKVVASPGPKVQLSLLQIGAQAITVGLSSEGPGGPAADSVEVSWTPGDGRVEWTPGDGEPVVTLSPVPPGTRYEIRAIAAYRGGEAVPDVISVLQPADSIEPVNIRTPEALLDVATSLDRHHVLLEDIDMTGRSWSPIGLDLAPGASFEGEPFSGVFDGGGHAIRNLSFEDRMLSFVGLFGLLSEEARVFDLDVVDASFVGQRYAGGIAARSFGEIERCRTSGSIVADNIEGGIVGHNLGRVSESHSTMSLTARGPENQNRLGGVVGWNEGTVSDVYARGGVTGRFYIGSAVGINAADGELIHAYGTGLVTAEGLSGGLVGAIEDQATLNGGFYDAETTGQQDSGKGLGLDTVDFGAEQGFVEAGWDFDQVWIIGGSGYPELRRAPPLP